MTVRLCVGNGNGRPVRYRIKELWLFWRSDT